MAYEPLHHKYRPQTFAELVGQGAIATTLSNALHQGRIAPAYLFTGPRGTGKTSSARILAKSLNCITSETPTASPCGTCDVCHMITKGAALDVIEIDAASNTGVDNIRELIERAQFAPVQCRYKVYVIDECHMLSTAAFNALLKTLEEPPARVVFVLATTDPQRVLPTIISRCQRFNFRRIPLQDMTDHLQAIAQKESIPIASDAVQLIAQISQGGLRDAESLLDQLSLLDGEITVDRVWELVGAVPEKDLMVLVKAIAQDDAITVLEQARHLMNRGREPLIVLQNLAGFYRDLLIAKTAGDRPDLVALTPPTWAELRDFAQTVSLDMILAGQQHLRSTEVQVKNTTQPRLWLEVTLVGLLPSSLNRQPVSAPAQAPPATVPSSGTAPSHRQFPPVAPSMPTTAPVAPPVSATPTPTPTPTPAPQPASSEPNVTPVDARSTPLPAPPVPVATSLEGTWQQVIEHLHPLSKALLRDHGRLTNLTQTQAEITISSQNLIKIAQSKVPDIEAAFKQVVSHPIKINLLVATPGSAESMPSQAEGRSPQPSASLSTPAPAPTPTPTKAPSSPIVRETSAPAPPVDALPSPVPEQRPAPLPTLPTPSGDVFEPPVWVADDEITRAAKSFAQMFNGQIVGNEVDALPSPASPVPPSDLPPPLPELDTEEDDDIPF